MTINFGFAIRIAAPGAISRARKRIDIARLKLTIVSHVEWVRAPGNFPQMGRNFRARGSSLAADMRPNTDTPSDVSVAASEECHRFATHSATDQRLVSAENVPKSQPLKQGGGGQAISAGERLPNPI